MKCVITGFGAHCPVHYRVIHCISAWTEFCVILCRVQKWEGRWKGNKLEGKTKREKPQTETGKREENVTESCIKSLRMKLFCKPKERELSVFLLAKKMNLQTNPESDGSKEEWMEKGEQVSEGSEGEG